MSATQARLSTAVVWASWPIGFALIMGNIVGGIFSPPVFLLLVSAYALAVAAALRNLPSDTKPRRDAVLLVLSGPMVFVLAGLTGPPTAASPGPMLLNAAVLAGGTAVLVVAAVGLVLHQGRVGRSGLLGLVALLVATAGWVVNLVFRWAVVLSGASTVQAEVEAEAWMATVYLRGLPRVPDPMSFALVWMDLLQIVYVILSYCAFALIAVVLTERRVIERRAGVLIAGAATTLAVLVSAAAAVSAWVAPVGEVAALTAFVLTIPFMTTFVPYLLGAVILTHREPDRVGPPAGQLQPSR